MDIGFWIMIILIVGWLLISNRSCIGDLLSKLWINPKYKVEKIQTNEISFTKPAGFFLDSSLLPVGYLEKFRFYSGKSKGCLSIINGETINESFNEAWCSVSVAEGLDLEIYRNAAMSSEKTILSESEEVSSDGKETTLQIKVTGRTQFFEIESSFRIIENRRRNRTYELIFNVLTEVKDDYAQRISDTFESFRMV
jgi:hypothetical protein